MALESMTKMLQDAKAGGYAVGQFNINNLEYVQAILQAAEEEKSPAILGVSEGAGRYMGGYGVVVAMVKAVMEAQGTTVPIAIHLDHGSSFDECAKAIQAGFTSVMIDASHDPFEENIAKTSKVVELAHLHGVSVESELGTVGGQEDDVVGDIIYADPKECKELVERTGIDTLAPALGSVHGTYKGEPNLGFKEMEEIGAETGLPLVLHGASGAGEENIKKAVSFGINKINVYTDLLNHARNYEKMELNSNPEIDYMELQSLVENEMKEYIKKFMRLISSSNQYQYSMSGRESIE